MSSRPSVQDKAQRPAWKIVLVVAACGLVIGVLFGVVYYNVHSTALFGIGSNRVDASSEIGHLAVLDSDEYKAYIGKGSNSRVSQSEDLLVATSYDITSLADGIDEEMEAERKAAEEAAKREEQEKIAQAKEHMQNQQKTDGIPSSITAVNWDVGKEAFISEWTNRIDAFLEGFPLEGCGKYFAEAAWEYGVDPRWSPAIANTESTRGKACFLPHNAWGWGARAWSNWENAINDHVKGLADGYGYTISLESAKKYCPPSYNSWYNNTLWAMQQI